MADVHSLPATAERSSSSAVAPSLPRDVIKQVFQWLGSPEEVLRVMPVCKEWHSIANEPDLLQNFTVILNHPDQHLPRYACKVEVNGLGGAACIAASLSDPPPLVDNGLQTHGSSRGSGSSSSGSGTSAGSGSSSSGSGISAGSGSSSGSMNGSQRTASLFRVHTLSGAWCRMLDVIGADTVIKREQRSVLIKQALLSTAQHSGQIPGGLTWSDSVTSAGNASHPVARVFTESVRGAAAAESAPSSIAIFWQQRRGRGRYYATREVINKAGVLAPCVDYDYCVTRRDKRQDRVVGAQQLVLHLGHSLHTLDLSGSGLGPDEMKVLAALTGLRSLNVSFNSSLGDEGCRHMSALTQLSSLDVRSCEVSASQMWSLTKLTQLEELYAGSNKLGADGMAHVASMKRLKVLDASRNDVRNEGVALLSGTGLTDLHTLALAGNSIDHTGLRHLEALTGLKSLDLKSNPVSFEEVQKMRRVLTCLTCLVS